MRVINKKAFSTMDFVIAMLLFSGVIALLILSVGSMANEYENPNVVNEEFAEKFDSFDEDTLRAQEMWNATTGEGGLSLVGSIEILFFSTFRVIQLVFSSVVEAGAQLFNLGEYFGIPQTVSIIFFTIISSALTVIIIFQVLSFVKGGRDL